MKKKSVSKKEITTIYVLYIRVISLSAFSPSLCLTNRFFTIRRPVLCSISSRSHTSISFVAFVVETMSFNLYSSIDPLEKRSHRALTWKWKSVQTPTLFALVIRAHGAQLAHIEIVIKIDTKKTMRNKKKRKHFHIIEHLKTCLGTLSVLLYMWGQKQKCSFYKARTEKYR